MSRVRRRVVVRGDVHGVGFRWSAAREADRRGLAGWVRNRSDGTVEAVVEGVGTDVEAFVAWSRHGPRGASVREVEVTDEPLEHLTAFEIEP